MNMDAGTLAREVVLAQSGDLSALDRVLREVQMPLFRFVKATLGRDRDAEDVTQEALLTVCRKLKWLDEPRAFRGWAFQIAWRLAIREISRAERRELRHEELGDTLPGTPEPDLDPWMREAIRSGITSLSPACRGVVELHYLEELTIGEVAEVLGIRTGTAKSRLASGLKQLRETVKRQER